jgi:hypothetical protein
MVKYDISWQQVVLWGWEHQRASARVAREQAQQLEQVARAARARPLRALTGFERSAIIDSLDSESAIAERFEIAVERVRQVRADYHSLVKRPVLIQ